MDAVNKREQAALGKGRGQEGAVTVCEKKKERGVEGGGGEWRINQVGLGGGVRGGGASALPRYGRGESQWMLAWHV